MKTTLQLVVVVGLACIATSAFEVSGAGSLARLFLIFPIFPGAVAGLWLSGHGGNHSVSLVAALVTNSLIWSIAWLGLRTFIRAVRR